VTLLLASVEKQKGSEYAQHGQSGSDEHLQEKDLERTERIDGVEMQQAEATSVVNKN